MALSLFVTIPSGENKVLSARQNIVAAMHGPGWANQGNAMPTLKHVDKVVAPLPMHHTFIGIAGIEEFRPSKWCNPFTVLDPGNATDMYSRFLRCRCDLQSFLSPLLNRTLVCNCLCPGNCHGSILIDLCSEFCSSSTSSWSSTMQDVDSNSCTDSEDANRMQRMELDSSDFQCVRTEHASSSSARDSNEIFYNDWPKVGLASETCLSTLSSRSVDNPPEWRQLIDVVRDIKQRAFWEICSGAAVLTAAFAQEGWAIAPPLDICYNQAVDLLNPAFIAVVIGLILEGSFLLVHLGPPCSSFSIAVNRFPSYRMRDALHPAGLPNLPRHRQEKVDLGNALAECAARLAKAQTAAKGYWQLEQPDSSIMWKLPCIVSLNKDAWHAVRDVCVDGAPWRTPTAIASNHASISQLEAKCKGGHCHIQLAGKAPCGTNWTALASPYRPAFANARVDVWSSVKKDADNDIQKSTAWRTGQPTFDVSQTWDQALELLQFTPSGKRTRETVAARIAAGLQPRGLALPQMLPDF